MTIFCHFISLFYQFLIYHLTSDSLSDDFKVPHVLNCWWLSGIASLHRVIVSWAMRSWVVRRFEKRGNSLCWWCTAAAAAVIDENPGGTGGVCALRGERKIRQDQFSVGYWNWRVAVSRGFQLISIDVIRIPSKWKGRSYHRKSLKVFVIQLFEFF